MITVKALTRILSEQLGVGGYSRKGRSWYFAQDRVLSVVNLQKSNYDQQYFLNIGFYYQNLGELREPKEHQCHVRARATSQFRDHVPSVERLLFAEDASLEEQEHEELFATFVAEELLPLCRSMSSEAALKRAIRQDELEGWLVTRDMREATSPTR